ncbi:leucine zipper domain-containing protein [Saccharopolyspora sp. NPDC050389]|uniref:helix-turn-helix domain-containing protein n=1 Tax=Saccharopolyspora sp. NPDC050389 TaxID=3155516 RepID=UPI0033DCC7B8
MSEPQLDREVRRRLAILRHVEEVSGNVAMTCRYYGISRPGYYKWLHRYETEGVDGLRDRSKRPRTSPNTTRAEVVDKIIHLRQHYHFGPSKIAVYLQRVPSSSLQHRRGYAADLHHGLRADRRIRLRRRPLDRRGVRALQTGPYPPDLTALVERLCGERRNRRYSRTRSVVTASSGSALPGLPVPARRSDRSRSRRPRR